MNLKAKPFGFTLIELLVVISIIGLLSTLAVVSFGNARQKSRDTKRVADIKSIQTGLELYFGDHDKYPTVAIATPITLGPGASKLLCNSTSGFETGDTCASSATLYIYVPKDPSTNSYKYSSADGSTYTITFTTEQTTVQGLSPTAAHTASPAGMQ